MKLHKCTVCSNKVSLKDARRAKDKRLIVKCSHCNHVLCVESHALAIFLVVLECMACYYAAKILGLWMPIASLFAVAIGIGIAKVLIKLVPELGTQESRLGADE